LVKQNWTLITCSGTLGRVCYVYKNYEDYAASQHILRVNPNENLIDTAYLNCFLSSDYGYHQLLRYRYGAVIDEIDDKNIEGVLIPMPTEEQQKEIGDLVRKAYELRAEAIKLEDEAQELFTQALTQA
jgi:type I restriction enzyme S subunit